MTDVPPAAFSASTCAKPGCAGGHQPGKCTGHASDGTGRPCRRDPMKGQAVCASHGGRAPRAKAAAELRQNEELAKQDARRLGVPVQTTGVAALQDALARAHGDVLYWSARMRLLDDDELKQQDASGRFERPAVWVELYERAMRHYADTADRCVARGIEAAAVSVVQAQGQQVVELLRRVLSGLGLNPSAPDVVEVVVRELRAVDGEAAA